MSRRKGNREKRTEGGGGQDDEEEGVERGGGAAEVLLWGLGCRNSIDHYVLEFEVLGENGRFKIVIKSGGKSGKRRKN